jgi:hypothetical protein
VELRGEERWSQDFGEEPGIKVHLEFLVLARKYKYNGV